MKNRKCDFCGETAPLTQYHELWLCAECSQEEIKQCQICGKHVHYQDSRQDWGYTLCDSSECEQKLDEIAEDFEESIRETYQHLNSWLNNNR